MIFWVSWCKNKCFWQRFTCKENCSTSSWASKINQTIRRTRSNHSGSHGCWYNLWSPSYTPFTLSFMSNCILKILKNCRNKSVYSSIISKINIQWRFWHATCRFWYSLSWLCSWNKILRFSEFQNFKIHLFTFGRWAAHFSCTALSALSTPFKNNRSQNDLTLLRISNTLLLSTISRQQTG